MPSRSIGITSSGGNPTPIVEALDASDVTTVAMTLNGSVTNFGHSTTLAFEWSTSLDFSTYGTLPATPSSVSNSNTTAISKTIFNLFRNTLYYYRVAATTAGVVTRSSIKSQRTYLEPSWSDSTLSRPRLNTIYSDSVSATGFPTPTYSITSGSLPAGLTLNSTTGAITGTPTATNQYTFTVSASNVASTTSASYTMLVSTGIEGGTEYNVSGLRIHEFTGAGTLTNFRPGAITLVSGFIYAGGGGGGNSVGGGGGAGKWSGGSFYIAPGAPISCTIGAGGARQTNYLGGQGFTGSSSTLTTSTISGFQTGTTFTVGGGGGGGFYNANTPTAGTSRNSSTEGSGGGGSGGVGVSSLGGTGLKSGGRGQNYVNGRYVAGGGGGAFSNGVDGDAVTGVSGRGGDGEYFTPAGRYFGAGGGGGGDAIGPTGSAGDIAGTSGNTIGNNAPFASGSGGGGCRNASGGVSSGAGGGGVFLVYYAR